MRELLALVAAGGLIYGFCFEILRFGEVRREGRLTPFDYGRFRRRSLGIVLLAFLAAQILTLDFAEEFLDGDNVTLFAWYGIALILVFWLIQVAFRDFKAEMLRVIDESRKTTVESFEEIERMSRGEGTDK